MKIIYCEVYVSKKSIIMVNMRLFPGSAMLMNHLYNQGGEMPHCRLDYEMA